MHVFVCMYAVCVSWDKMKAEQASIYTTYRTDDRSNKGTIKF